MLAKRGQTIDRVLNFQVPDQLLVGGVSCGGAGTGREWTVLDGKRVGVMSSG